MLCSVTSRRRQCVCSAVTRRGPLPGICILLFLIQLTACVGPHVHKAPSSPTQESVVEQKQPADAATQEESGLAGTLPPPVSIPLPVPPVEAAQSEAPQESGEIPVIEAKPVFVTAQRESYTVDAAFTATKTDTPLMETPVSVQVVPKQVLQDQRVNRLQEALENVSGIRSHNNDLSGYSFKIRGFNSFTVFRNALSVPVAIPSTYETANLERVEVLKGPAAVLFGRVEPGGLINLVTKRPLSQPYYKLEQEFGSYDHYRTVWDATGPLNQSGTVGYRFSGAFQDHGSFRDFQGGQRTFLAPVLSFKPGANTDLVVEFQYMKNRAESDMGLPALGNRPAPVPRSRSFQEPNDPRDWHETYNLSYELIHRFSDNWSLTNRFLYSHSLLHSPNVTATGLDEATGTLDRVMNFQRLKGDAYSTNLDLKGKFDLLGTKHNLLVGVDYLYSYYDYRWTAAAENFPINIFNPVYGTIPSSAVGDAAGAPGFLSSVQSKQTGLYVQDQVTLFDKLHVLLGGRYDSAEVHAGASDTSKEAAIADRHAQPGLSDHQFSLRAGLLYQFTPWLSGYASYAKSFGANNGLSATGAPLPPEKGAQYEVGVKAEVGAGLSVNLAVFHLTKKNILTPDFSTPNPNDLTAIGESRSQGVELDLVGSLTPRLNLIANYAYIETKVTRDDSGLQGNRFDNVPRHSGRVFLTYHLGSDDGLGWRVGGGVTASAKAAGDPQNTYELPAYTRLDAFTSYSMMIGRTRWTAQLNLRNVLNTKYFSGTDIFYNQMAARQGILPAQPFTAIGTIRMEF